MLRRVITKRCVILGIPAGLALSLLPLSGSAGSGGYARTLAHYDVPDIRLIDMHGREIRIRDALRDQEPNILQFMFTTCSGICPISSALLAGAQQNIEAVGGNVRFWSISIDPEADTPDRLHAYAEAYGAGPNWQFFTGRLDDIVALQKAFDAYRDNKTRHEPLIFIRLQDDQWIRLDGLLSVSEFLSEYHRATNH
jgi:protein SCO1/2